MAGRDAMPVEPITASSGAGTVLLLVLALLAAGIGLLSLSQATAGVGMLAGACLLAICARIAQAARQHRDVLRAMQPPR